MEFLSNEIIGIILSLQHAYINISVCRNTGYAGCKKYEEGPAFSLASKKNRVINEWKVDKLFSISQGVIDDLSSEAKKSKMEFHFTEKKVTMYIDGKAMYTTDWKFSSKKEALVVGTGADEEIWNIVRLTQNEFFFETEPEDDEYGRFELISK